MLNQINGSGENLLSLCRPFEVIKDGWDDAQWVKRVPHKHEALSYITNIYRKAVSNAYLSLYSAGDER